MKMNKNYLWYNIHNLVHVFSNVNIDVISKHFLKENCDEAPPFVTDNRLIIEVTETSSQDSRGYYFNEKEKTVGIRSKKGFVDIFFELKNLDEKTTIFRVSPWVLKIPILKQKFTDTILHILDLKLIKKGFAMIHAAAGVYKGNGYILGGGFGAGKSLSTFFLIKNDATYFTDDIIIVNKAATMFSYPLKIALYPYHFRLCSWLKKPSFYDMLKIYLRGFVHTVIPLESGIQIVNPFIGEKEIFEVFPDVKIGDSHKIDYLVLLETLSEKKYELVEVSDERIFFEKFFITNKKVFNYEYSPLILAYSYYFPEFLSVMKLLEREKEIIESVVHKSRKKLVSRAWGELHANQLMNYKE